MYSVFPKTDILSAWVEVQLPRSRSYNLICLNGDCWFIDGVIVDKSKGMDILQRMIDAGYVVDVCNGILVGADE